MPDPVLATPPKKFFETYLGLCADVGADVEFVRDLALRIARAVAKNEDLPPEAMEVEDRWYRSLEGDPDWSVYAGDYYLAEMWSTWVNYSRVYIRAFLGERLVNKKVSFAEYAHDVESVLDMGCGTGLGTAALKEVFPNARVVGSNLEGTRQIEIARALAKDYGFEVVTKVEGHFDMIFASEYFEHLTSPVAHLRSTVEETTPRLLLTANSFHASAVGHFPCYFVDGKWVEGRKVSRIFNDEVRRLGYGPVKVDFWNHRPRTWVKGRRKSARS